MKKWLKKFWCWITGGHTYADRNLQCCRDEVKMMFRYRNRCCKCGMTDKWEIPMENILPKKVRPSTYVYVEEGEDNA